MSTSKWLDKVPDVLTVENVPEVLRFGRNAAYELVRTGGLFAVRIGGRSLCVPESALVAYWAESTGRRRCVGRFGRNRSLRSCSVIADR